MRNVIKTDYNRALRNINFLLAVLLIFLIWELNSIRLISSETQDVLYIFIHTRGRSTTLLLVLVAASIPYVAAYCEDAENHLLRYCILRTGSTKYTVSKIIVCFSTAFLVLVLGTVLFVCKQSFHFPLVSETSLAVENFKPDNCLGGLLPAHTNIYIGIQIFLDGLYCGGMSVLALGLSSFVRNSHAVFVFPFILDFCFYNLFADILQAPDFLDASCVYDSCTGPYIDNPVFFLAYAVFFTGILTLIGYMIMLRKVKGEFL